MRSGMIAALALAFSIVVPATRAAQPGNGQQPVVLNASADFVNQRLAINGLNFGTQPPNATLDGMPLTVLGWTDTSIDAVLPAEAAANPGSYLLGVSRAQGGNVAYFEMAIGAVGPAGPQGDTGPQGETGPPGPQGDPGTSVLDLPNPTFAGTVTAGRLHITDTGTPSLVTTSSSTIGTWHELINTTAGGRNWTLISTGTGNGEGAGKLLIHDQTGGGNAMVIDPNHRVGIGTNFPAVKLDIIDAGWPTLRVISSSPTGTWHELINTTPGGHNWNLISTGTGNGEGPGKLLINDQTSGGNRLVIDQTGKVGIGTAAPDEKLTVIGDVKATGGYRFGDGTLQSSAVRVARRAATIDFGSFYTTAIVVGSLPGADPGASLSVSPDRDLPAGLMIAWARISAPGVYRVAVVNTTGVPVDPPAITFYLSAVNP